MLLAKLEVDQLPSHSSGFRYHLPPLQPSGHFLLLPSQSSTLLLKPVAVRELMLPCDLANVDTLPQDCVASMAQVLTQVCQSNCFCVSCHSQFPAQSLGEAKQGPLVLNFTKIWLNLSKFACLFAKIRVVING